jgi:uncharacterized protein YdaU (DUF1376 family)
VSEKVDIFMPIYIADYLSDTNELSAEEHGAYLLLLMAAWKRGGRLPTDSLRLQRLAMVPEKRWQRVWGMIARFFSLDGDALVQHRLNRELAKAMSRRESASANGRRSAEARRVQRSDQPTDNGRSTGVGTAVTTPVGTTGATERSTEPQRNSNSSPSGSLSLISEQSDPDQTPAQSKVRAKWTAAEWLKRFGAAWIAKYGGLAYGGGDAAARAGGQLRDIIDALPESDVLAAQARAGVMIAEFMGDMSPRVVAARHPFAFFVTAFTGLRVPRIAAKPPAPPWITADRDRDQRASAERAESRIALAKLTAELAEGKAVAR